MSKKKQTEETSPNSGGADNEGFGLDPAPAQNGKPKLTRRERFLKYAPRRVQKVLNAFRQLGNVTNKGSYEYSEAEVSKIMDAISNGVTILRNKFAGSKEVKEVFQL